MNYDIYITGRANPMRFTRLSTAEAYRRAILRTVGKMAWLVASPA